MAKASGKSKSKTASAAGKPPASALKTVAIKTLVFAADNPVAHDDRNLALIGKSLAEFGQVENLVAQHGSNVLIAGEGRVRAMAAAGVERAEVRFVRCSDAQRRKLAALLNRSGDLHAWSKDRVEALVNEVVAAGGAAEDIGFSDKELAKLVASALDVPPADEGEQPPPAGEYRNQYGVIVLCETETQQQQVYEELVDQGYSCKVVVT